MIICIILEMLGTTRTANAFFCSCAAAAGAKEVTRAVCDEMWKLACASSNMPKKVSVQLTRHAFFLMRRLSTATDWTLPFHVN